MCAKDAVNRLSIGRLVGSIYALKFSISSELRDFVYAGRNKIVKHSVIRLKLQLSVANIDPVKESQHICQEYDWHYAKGDFPVHRTFIALLGHDRQIRCESWRAWLIMHRVSFPCRTLVFKWLDRAGNPVFLDQPAPGAWGLAPALRRPISPTHWPVLAA